MRFDAPLFFANGDKLATFGLATRLGRSGHYPTLEGAVDAWRQDPKSG